MQDFKLKIILSVLSGIMFSFIFILLAFALPIHKKEDIVIAKPKGKLEKIAYSMKNR